MAVGDTLTYLHMDQLGSTVLETAGVNVTADQRYFAFGRQRDAGPVVTDYRFTGQKEDATGLVYMNARYYDPALGQFISPDTIVPDATNVFDYNRYMYGRGNSLRYNDPSGHDPACIGIPIPFFAISCHAGSWIIQNGPTVVNLVSQWADKLPAVGDWFFGSSNAAEQGSHSAGQQNAGDSSTGDPNDPFGFNRFTKLVRDKGADNLQRDLQSKDASNRTGAERVLNIMNKLGDQVQRVGVSEKVSGVRTSDIDILDTAGNVHEVGAHTAAQLGQKFQYAQAWIAQSANPNAKIFYWHFGELTQDIINTVQRWGVEIRVMQ